MIDFDTVREAVARAAEVGYVRIGDALAESRRRTLLEEAASLSFEPLEPVIGRVRQSGDLARVRPHEPSLPRLDELTTALEQAIRRSGVPGSERFLANEAMFQRYEVSHVGVSAHRDQGFYRGVVAVFTLEGSAPFAILDKVSEDPIDEWATEPGDLYLLAGGGLGDADRRPLHRVEGPVAGRRVSLTLRMKERAG